MASDAVYLRFDGMTWPNPDDPGDVEWALRYGTPTRQVLLVAASYIGAYQQLVNDTGQVRDAKIRGIRLARSLDSEQTTDPRPSLVSPCPVCGFADWPEGGMHAAKSIHLLAHERARDFDVEQIKEQEET